METQPPQPDVTGERNGNGSENECFTKWTIDWKDNQGNQENPYQPLNPPVHKEIEEDKYSRAQKVAVLHELK